MTACPGQGTLDYSPSKGWGQGGALRLLAECCNWRSQDEAAQLRQLLAKAAAAAAAGGTAPEAPPQEASTAALAPSEAAASAPAPASLLASANLADHLGLPAAAATDLVAAGGPAQTCGGGRSVTTSDRMLLSYQVLFACGTALAANSVI